MNAELEGDLRAIAARAERIEREKEGRALTDAEITTLRAAAFVRRVFPQLFEKSNG
jgi:hypothetical protein